MFDTNDIIKHNEINSLMNINPSVNEESYGNLSVEVLNLFTLYNQDNCTNENSSKEKLGNKLRALMLEKATINFISVGKYKLESFVCTKYFDVHFRKFSLNDDSSVYDILIYDVTELITSRQKLFEEGIIKDKVIVKIVHEFKTPINSIIGVIGNIEDLINSSNMQHDKTTSKHLETIRNLSRYVIFLISDIIHFTNLKSLPEIKINPQDINLREIANFSFDILKSLLRCNKSKEEAIQPQLDYEDEIDNLIIKTDELRLKQIVLNIISNAVKFTRSGWIKIRCSIFEEKFVRVSISDTGIGIPESEQGRLFNDFQMVKNTSVNNEMGSGLGLSICKSLASSMKIQISSTSIYGKGSEFSLAIPIEQDDLSKRSSKNLIAERKSSRRDQINPMFVEDLKAMNDYLNSSELPPRMELNLENEVPMQDSFPENRSSPSIYKSLDTSRLISNINSPGIGQNSNSSRTVKFGDDHIFSNINLLRFNKSITPHSQRISQSSGMNSNYSIVISPPNRHLEITKKEKILIVDDNHYNSESTKNILKKVLKEAGRNMEIVIGSDGVDLLHHIIQDQSKGNEIKCILTDENMEYINGSEAIRIIRGLEKRHKIKFVNIISVTGNEESQYTDEIKKAGAQLVMSKPLPKSLIAKALKDLNII